MSNHHSDVDVDDVLSSVRRLVSDETEENRATLQSQAADRLVLTPAFRVEDDAKTSDFETSSDDPDGAVVGAKDLNDGAEDGPSTQEAQLYEGLDPMEDTIDPPVDDSRLAPTNDYEGSTEADDSATAQSLERSEEEEAGIAASETNLRAISLEDRIAELEAAVNAQRDEFEPDGSEDVSAHVPEAALQAQDPEPSSGGDEEASIDVAERLAGVEAGTEALGENPLRSELETGPKDTEADEARQNGEPDEASLEIGPAAALSFRHHGFGATRHEEPDEDTQEADVSQAGQVLVETIDKAPFESVSEPEPVGSDPAGEFGINAAAPAIEEESDAFETQDGVSTDPSEVGALDEDVSSTLDEAILDEEALRELVGQLVRQELQGELGERITRNVRKLVRREIQIALAARTFDKE